MSKSIFRLTASALILALAFSLSTPATAGSVIHDDAAADTSVPVILDALTMRPLGFAAMCVGFVWWTLNTPIMAITRPTDMHKSFKSMVILPARYTFVDPIGYHPDRRAAERTGTIQ